MNDEGNWQHNPDTGLVEPLRYLSSPNCDARPADQSVDVLVIHAISLPPSCYGNSYVEDLFCNCLDPQADPYFETIHNIPVSSHFYIKRSGESLQFVPTHLRAWHAGESLFQGRERVNDFSIGIELEGSDKDAFEDIQYQRLATLTRAVVAAYPAITGDSIVGHSDVSPGRKTDPGPGFNWEYFRGLISD